MKFGFCSMFTRRFFGLWASSTLRKFCSEAQDLTNGEQKIQRLLQTGFPKAELVQVEDISGGCGSMYAVKVVSKDFQGVIRVQQHKMVNEVLKKEISDMHGIRIFTETPSN